MRPLREGTEVSACYLADARSSPLPTQGITVISDQALVNGEYPVEEGDEVEVAAVAKDDDEEWEDEGESNYGQFNR